MKHLRLIVDNSPVAKPLIETFGFAGGAHGIVAFHDGVEMPASEALQLLADMVGRETERLIQRQDEQASVGSIK